MANKELTAKIKLDSSDAESKLKKLESLIKSINRAVTGHANTSQLESSLTRQVIQAERAKQATLKTAQYQEKLSQEIGKTFIVEEKVTQAIANSQTAQERAKQAVHKTAQEIGKEYLAEERLNQALMKTEDLTSRVKSETKEAASSATILSKMFQSSNRHANSLLSTVKRLASTYLGVMGMRTAITTSDTITKAQNKLNNLNGGNTQLTQEQMDKMYVSANKVRMAYTDMLSNASKSMVLAGDAFQGNMDNAIRFQEIMAETYALGGASAPEMSNSMYQLIQALGSGTLAGDELRAVREGAPLAYKAIEEFAQGVYNSTDSLKEMASQGKITSEIVVAAIMNAGDNIDAQFQDTAVTFEQAWDRIKSAAVKAFEPVSNALNQMLNEAVKNGAFEKIEQAFVKIGETIVKVFNIMYDCVVWIVDNWNWLKHALVGVLIAVIAYQLLKTGISIYCAYVEMQAWMAANNVTWAAIGSLLVVLGVIVVIIAAVLALAYVFILWKTGAIDTCEAIVDALLVVAAAIAIISLITGNWILAIVALAIAAIAAIIAWLDYFLAIVYSIIACIWNMIVGVINAIIQFIWAKFVVPFINIIEWILNACNGGFNSLGGAVANLVGQMISWFLSLGQVVTTIIDAIFGTNWTGGLESLKDAVVSWGKSEDSITLSREAPTIQSITGWNIDRWAVSDAWDTGMSHGAIAKDWLNDLGSDFQNTGSTNDSLVNTLNPNYDTTGAYKAPTTEDMINNALGKDVGDISDNTGSMADSMELAEEDLAYLRKLADMEWKKEFTTATITVDMSNYNTINGESDLDGIVTKLGDKLREELNVVADGVYV